MSEETNTATFQQAAALLNEGDVDAFADLLFAVDAVDHDPALGQGPGREGYRAFFRTLLAAFPDARLEPAAQVADEYTLTGTHRGDFHGAALGAALDAARPSAADR